MLPGRTKPGRLPDGWSGKERRCGCFWTSRVWQQRIISPSAPTGSACCGASGVKGHVARRAIAGWSGSYHFVTPVASGGVQRFRFPSKPFLVCLKVKDLICTGSRSTRPCRYPLPRDQIQRCKTTTICIRPNRAITLFTSLGTSADCRGRT